MCIKSFINMVFALTCPSLPGDDYRLLVLNGRVIAAALRRPPFVTGDGTHTIRQLYGRMSGPSITDRAIIEITPYRAARGEITAPYYVPFGSTVTESRFHTVWHHIWCNYAILRSILLGPLIRPYTELYRLTWARTDHQFEMMNYHSKIPTDERSMNSITNDHLHLFSFQGSLNWAERILWSWGIYSQPFWSDRFVYNHSIAISNQLQLHLYWHDRKSFSVSLA